MSDLSRARSSRAQASPADGLRRVELRVYFTGMMVFTDRFPRPGLPASEMVALFVDMRRMPEYLKEPYESCTWRHRPDEGPRFARFDPHRAVVQVDLENLLPEEQALQHRLDPSSFPLKYFDDALQRDQRIWVLDSDVLEVSDQHSLDPDELVVEDAELGDSTLPLNEDHGQSLRWLAPLEAPECPRPRLKKSLLVDFGHSLRPSPLVAAMRFRRGRLRTVAFASELRRFVVWRYPADGRLRTYGTVVEHSMTFGFPAHETEPIIEVTSTKFDRSLGRTLRLTPKPGEDSIEIWVLNLEWEQIKRQHPPRPVLIGDPNPELLFYFSLLEKVPRDPQLPVAEAHRDAILSPGLFPCRSPGMRRLYFPSSSGEILSSSPCCPVRFG